MTRKTPIKAHTPLNRPKRDYASLADQWIDRNWYLPPSGDQSWRDREAQRIFGDGEEPVKDKENPGRRAGNGFYEPGFRRAKTLAIVLPISLAVCVLLFAGAILLPGILTPGFWGPSEPKARPPVAIMNGPAEAPQSLAYDDGQAAAPIKVHRNTITPLPRPSIMTRDESREIRATTPPETNVAEAPPPKKRATRSLPPIGEAYFASHAPADEKLVAVSSPPIGQAYFESHSPID